MGDGTSISWTDATWNPIRGCRRTAPAGSKQSGCGDPTGGGCYAERQAARFCGEGQAYEGLITLTANGPRWSGKVKFVAEHLADPLRWRKPRRIFVDSMSDLFYEGFTNEQIAAVFGVMAAAPQHTFQVLTKRADRMRDWFAWFATAGDSPGEVLAGSLEQLAKLDDATDPRFVDEEWLVGLINVVNGVLEWRNTPRPSAGSGVPRWPLPNVWPGVSVENQAAANERIPLLLDTPAAIRFLSCEPLLEPVSLTHLRGAGNGTWRDALSGRLHTGPAVLVDEVRVDWVIVGCESGPGARPADVAWFRSLRDQCAAAGVPFFLKQAVCSIDECTKHNPIEDASDFCPVCNGQRGVWAEHGSKVKRGGVIELPHLDGVRHAAFPEVPR